VRYLSPPKNYNQKKPGARHEPNAKSTPLRAA
jgi:hypothetical protein